MTERTSRKIPVTERQFLWVQDDDKGEVTLHVGPTMVSPTAADRVVVDDGEGGFREDVSGRPQSMIELGDSQYAVMSNPLLEADLGPNGRFKSGRNEPRPLRNGTRSMIPGPCSFYLRPGQRVDVRDAHELASNQYLVVKVYGEVDHTAPYYEVTGRSATITRATAEQLDEARPVQSAEVPPVELKRGQLIVIRGLDTQFYIPPTGVDIVPDTSLDDSGASVSASAARQILAQLPPEVVPAPPPPERNLDQTAIATEEEADDYAPRGGGGPRRQVAGAYVDQSARTRGRKMAAPLPPGMMAQAPAPAYEQAKPMLQEPPVNVPDGLAVPAIRRALEKEARQARLIRRAVVLGEKEYCVIIDPDGKREIKVGPARVFPGPYDTFMTVGSRQRIYDAYELLPQRALWLRVIAAISRADLSAKVPRGFALDKDQYYPGDEVLLTGVSTFFFPFNEIEVLSPETGEAVVGNDHSRVFIEAIGIDQKSGIYVRDLSSGEVKLIRGQQSYLVDPRKQVQITRTVAPDDWNLWIAANETHKRVVTAVTTPWALSIGVPNNFAALVTSANARRVVEGPCVELLGYEEAVSAISLSTGTPKSTDSPLRTCFLRTVGNRVSDEIHVETSDFVKIAVTVSYSVTFLREHKDSWFNHENYIQVMVDHLRSIVRGRCRTRSLSSLWPELPSVVRDTILGERKDGAGRPGRTFAENGCIVTEVEVLASEIEDEDVAELMLRVQTESVTLTIGDRQAQESLVSARLRAQIDTETQRLAEEANTRAAKLEELSRRLAHDASLASAREAELLARERQLLADQREAAALTSALERQTAAKAAELKIVEEEARIRAQAVRTEEGAKLDGMARVRELEIAVINAQSAAQVAESNAVQRGLIEALASLGDKIMLADVAQNMNLVSLFKGKDIVTVLNDVLGGTKLAPTLRGLAEKFGERPKKT
jgi:major vault protein